MSVILQKDTEHSIAIWDPFAMPKALVAMPIEGIEKLPFMKDTAKVEYAMTFDEAEETTWQAIRSRVEERSNDNTLVRINLSDGVDAVSTINYVDIEVACVHLYRALASNFSVLALRYSQQNCFILPVGSVGSGRAQAYQHTEFGSTEPRD